MDLPEHRSIARRWSRYGSSVPLEGEFDWFTDWVQQRVGLTLTATTNDSLDAVLRSFRADPDPDRQLTWLEAADLQTEYATPSAGPLSPRSIELLRQSGHTPEQIRELEIARQRPTPQLVRVGRLGKWTAVIEQFSTRGTEPEVLQAISSSGAEVVVYCFTQTIVSLLYASNGDFVSGFDATVPTIRWGSDQSYFDELLQRVVGPLRPVAPAEIAQILSDGFDLTIDRAVLEGPLPSANLRP